MKKHPLDDPGGLERGEYKDGYMVLNNLLLRALI
jgi:hypothetical protein